MRVFILLFNARTNNEGVHTLQTGDRHKILMFEAEDDATRFALMLEAQDFPTPTVEAMDSREIEEFCRQADFDWELVEAGKLEIPPEENVEQTDWELGKQPDSKGRETEPASDSELSQAELERLRRRLEGLL
jgi:hypothetical protein